MRLGSATLNFESFLDESLAVALDPGYGAGILEACQYNESATFLCAKTYQQVEESAVHHRRRRVDTMKAISGRRDMAQSTIAEDPQEAFEASVEDSKGIKEHQRK